MDAFDYLLALYGLLLGLAVALIVVKLGLAARARSGGALTWMLAGYILVVAIRQWLSFDDARAILTPSAATLALVIGLAAPYCFAARAMFPSPDDATPRNDVHIIDNRSTLASWLIVPVLVSLAYNAFRPTSGVYHPVSLVTLWLLPLAVLSGFAFTRNRRWSAAGLILLIADNLLLIIQL